jgi:hypothetical protein
MEDPMAPKITLSGFYNFKITPFGTFVRVKFNSTHPVIPVVSVGRGKPTVKTSTGVDFDKTQLVSATFPLLAGPRTEHDVIVGPLPPNSELFVLFRGKDLLYSMRKFRTKRRRLDVHFGTILMNDDSDDLSDGDLKFGFFVDNNNKPQGKSLRFPGDGSEISIGTGKTKTIDVNATVFDSDFVTLAATGVDNDDDPSPGLDTDGLISATNPNAESGSNGVQEWVSGTQTVLVDFTGEEEAKTIPFIINAMSHTVDLHFQVTGTVKISYV